MSVKSILFVFTPLPKYGSKNIEQWLKTPVYERQGNIQYVLSWDNFYYRHQQHIYFLVDFVVSA